MSNLATVFQQHKVFIPFVVAGDPSAEATVQHVVALAQAGADIIELGIPFSDPVADGPVIQAADLRAFAGGISVAKVFDIVTEIRRQTDVPLVFLTYLNVVFHYGYDAFCARCTDLAIAGLVIPDLPVEERGELAPIATQHGIDLIPLITPTSSERVAQIAATATGFIYVVSSMGVTGERQSFATNLQALVTQIRQVTTIPTAIGFGIHTPQQAAEMATIADGVIVGSGVVDLITHHPDDATAALSAYTTAMTTAITQVPLG